MKNKETVTTADVARRAGLSKMTVSRVLNDHPYVSAETREKVMTAVRELGFTPNTLAKRFFTGRTQLVGLIMPIEFMFTSHYFKDLFRGVLTGLEDKGYDLLLHDSRSTRITPFDKALELVKGRLVDGLLVVAPMAQDDYVYRLTREGVPLVVMGESAHREEVSRVGIDNEGASALAVGRLIEAGHRNIAMLTFEKDHLEAQLREKGYRQALERAGIPIREELIGVGHYQRVEAYEETRRIFAAHPEVTAIYAANLEMALGARDALYSLDKKVPDDVSLVSFDDSHELEVLDPPITALRQKPYEVGLTAARMLMDIVDSKNAGEVRQSMIDTELVERSSIASPSRQGEIAE